MATDIAYLWVGIYTWPLDSPGLGSEVPFESGHADEE